MRHTLCELPSYSYMGAGSALLGAARLAMTIEAQYQARRGDVLQAEDGGIKRWAPSSSSRRFCKR